MITQQQRRIDAPRNAEEEYERTVENLLVTWKQRIANLAAKGCRLEADDLDASDYVEQRLLHSPEWETVTAIDISDIAYAAVVEQRGY